MERSTWFTIITTLLTSYYLLLLRLFPIFENYIYGMRNEVPGSCRVPQLNPFDESIMKYIKTPKNITCSPNGPLINSDLHYIDFNKHLLPAYGIDDFNKLKCCYQVFERKIPQEKKPDKEIIYLGKCKLFSSKVKIKDEFIKVICKYKKKVIYYDMFSFVPIKKNRNRNELTNTKQKLNVLIFGIDSLSHMNFQRHMPKTKKYIDEKLDSILMSGFNKVGDNTFPNLIPMLTGQSIKEIRNICWETDDTKFDKCHFIWNDYSNAGYLTAFAEDLSFLGLFNLHKLGFQVQPTHYYWRTFNYYAEEKIRNNYCLGPRPLHQVVIEYAKKYVYTLKDDLFFGIFWSSTLTHDCLNCPALSDDDYVNFIDELKRNNILNNTVVLFLSDHGIRFDEIVLTYQGHMEERLPFVYFIFPPWFRNVYPNAIKNMKVNSNRLTANYDIYETLKDLLYVENLKTKYLKMNEESFLGKRGISLFSFVPENRFCEMAGIASHWCTCKTRFEVYTYSTAVIKIANFIVSSINNMLINQTRCANLKLNSIYSVTLSKSIAMYEYYLKEYTITLSTSPSNAIFKSTVYCTDNCYEENIYEISGSISRLNKYGNQSSCISHNILRQFCYCLQ